MTILIEKNNALIKVCFILIFVSTFNTFVYLPILPMLASKYNVEPYKLQISVPIVILVTAPIQFLSGLISEKIGKIKVIIFVMITYLSLSILLLLTKTYSEFITIRLMQAIVTANPVLVRALIKDSFNNDEVPGKIGEVMIAVSLASLIGPSLGSLIYRSFGENGVFISISIVSLASIICCFKVKKIVIGKKEINRYKENLKINKLEFIVYTLVSGFISSVFTIYITLSAFFISQSYDLSIYITGMLISLNSFGYLIGNYSTGRFIKLYGERKIFYIGLTGSLLSVLTLLISYIFRFEGSLYFFIVMFFVGIGNGIALPISNSKILNSLKHSSGYISGLGSAIVTGISGSIALLVSSEVGRENENISLSLIMFILISMCFLVIFLGYLVKRKLNIRRFLWLKLKQ